MERRTKTIILILAILAILVVAGTAVFAIRSFSGEDYFSYISRGQKYMSSGDYDKAIVAFKKAMELDDSRTEAYTGLAEVYQESGQDALARDILTRGYDRTGSVTISLLMAGLDEDIETHTTEGGSDRTQLVTDTKEVSDIAAFNQELIDFISAADFGDYELAYGVSQGSVSGSVFTYSVDKLGVTITYDNSGATSLIDNNTGKPFSMIMPSSITVDNLAILFGKDSLTLNELKAISGISDLKEEKDSVSFTYKNCDIVISLSDRNITADSWNRIQPKARMTEENEQSEIKGRIRDVGSGNPIGDVTIRAYEGYSASGTPVETVSDSDGNYSLELPAGNAFVVVSKTGYISAEYSIYVLKNDSTGADFDLSKELGDGEIRLVLTWGSTPNDLDSHLIGTTDSGTDIHVNFLAKIAVDSANNKIAELDLDDVDAYGPETTTIYDMNGKYEFYVHDFSQSGIMSSSGAQVKIYRGNSLVDTIDICSGCGLYWSVVTIDHGVISVTNRPN